MILVDTSVWIDHFRSSDGRLAALLHETHALTHSWIIGELAVGGLRHRAEILRLLHGLPSAGVVTAAETLHLVESRRLYGLGIGYVDAQLLAATLVSPGTRLWSKDKPLRAAAERLGVAA